MRVLSSITEDDNRLALLEERLDGIEARIERLEKLYGIDHHNLGPHHTMVIYWPDEDQCYLVSVPCLRRLYVMNWNKLTHGDTYEEAARMGTEAIEVVLADGITEHTGE